MKFKSLFPALRDKSQEFLLNGVAASPLMPMRWRRKIYRLYGVELDDRSGPLIWLSNCIISGAQIAGRNLQVSSDTFINSGCEFYCGAPIIIGARCNIAMQVVFCTATHHLGDASRRAGAPLYLPITIGDGCWIGVRSTILPGVTIGDGCVIAAGAIVNRDCMPNGLYAGTPAKRIRDL